MTMKICAKTAVSGAKAAFTLVEVLIAFMLMVMVLTGVFFAYSQANRMIQISSMSMAAQSYASEGLERARSAQWDSQAPTNGDELPATNATTPVLMWPNLSSSPNYITNEGPQPAEMMDVPQTGNLLYVTNYIYETTNEVNPPLRELRSVTVWEFPLTGKLHTNILVTLRAPDE